MLCIPPSSYALSMNKQNVINLSRLYGFLLAQEFTLSEIGKKFPDLKVYSDSLDFAFSAKFSSADKVFEALSTVDTKKEMPILKEKLMLMIRQKPELTRKDAILFIQEMETRINEGIRSPELEYLLMFIYEKNPSEEFTKGFIKTYKTDGSEPKSKGIKLRIDIPLSWKSTDGKRPHIIQKWQNENGTGDEIIMLIIVDDIYNEGGSWTKEQLNEAIKNEEIHEFIPDGANLIDAGVFELEQQLGLWYSFEHTQNRADIADMNMRAHSFTLPFRGKFLTLMFSSGGLASEQKEIERRFELYKPLFKLVVNSLILEQVYE